MLAVAEARGMRGHREVELLSCEVEGRGKPEQQRSTLGSFRPERREGLRQRRIVPYRLVREGEAVVDEDRFELRADGDEPAVRLEDDGHVSPVGDRHASQLRDGHWRWSAHQSAVVM